MHFSTSMITLFIAASTAAALPAPEAGWNPPGPPAHPPPPKKGGKPWPPPKKGRKPPRGPWKRDGVEEQDSDEDGYATLVARAELNAAIEQELAARGWHGKGWNGWKGGKGWGWGWNGHPGWHGGKYWKRDDIDQELNEDGEDSSLAARGQLEAEYDLTAATDQELSARNWHPGWKGGKGWGWKGGYHGWHDGKKWKRDSNVLDQEVSDEDVYATLAARAVLATETDKAASGIQASAKWFPGWGWGWRHGGGWGWWGGHRWKRDDVEQQHQQQEAADIEAAQDAAFRAYVQKYGYGKQPTTEIKQRDVTEDYGTETGELATRDPEIEAYENEVPEQEIATRAENDQEFNAAADHGYGAFYPDMDITSPASTGASSTTATKEKEVDNNKQDNKE